MRDDADKMTESLANVARDLADALQHYARERHAEDRTRVAELQTQLCATRRVELARAESVAYAARDV
jgi:hypothetical protein